MAVFKVRIGWHQQVTLRVTAQSPVEAEENALLMVEENRVPREQVIESVRDDVQVEEGKTEAVG
jgi:hypothetical protein